MHDGRGSALASHTHPGPPSRVRSKHSQDVSVQFNLCNEPWLKYSLAAIADKGMKPAQLTSARLLTSVLYLETRQ